MERGDEPKSSDVFRSGNRDEGLLICWSLLSHSKLGFGFGIVGMCEGTSKGS